MNTEKDLELVEKFFDQELSRDDERIVEERLQSDPAFKALFEQEKILIRSIQLDGLRKDLDRLKQVEERLSASGAKPTLFRWWFAAAAAIAVIMLVWWMVPGRESPEELFQAYFQPYPNIFEPTVRGEATQTVRQQAFQAYESANYTAALELFASLPNPGDDPEVLMLSGNANLVLGNVTEARENFVSLIDRFDHLDLQAKWYLSLCYLKDGEIEKARDVLSELGQTEVSYAKKAQELLQKVK